MHEVIMMKIGDNLRRLRTGKGLTQAALAERLGVSDRAVSRWERDEAYPDVTLLPRLALLLGVSVDALLGVDSQRRQAAIDKALADCSACMQRGEAGAAVPLLRQALAAYPDEPELMAALARALMALYTEEAAREALALCRAAEGKKARLSTQYGFKQVAALALHRLGKSEQAAQLVSDEIPSFWVCRELLYPRVAPPEKAEGQRQFNLLWLTDRLCATLREMSRYNRTPPQAAALLETAIRIWQEVTAGHAGMYEERICRANLLLAGLYAADGQDDSAQSAWQQAHEAAVRYAAHDGRYTAPWLDQIHDQPVTPDAAQALMARVLAAKPAGADAPPCAVQD